MKKRFFVLLLLLLFPLLIFSQGSGSSLVLNGSSQYVSIPNSTELNPTTEITLEAWFKHTQVYSGVGTESIILKSFTSNTTPYYQYGLTTDGSNAGDRHFKFFLATSDNSIHVVSTPNDFYTVGEWYYICGTYDGSNMKLYINGELIETIAVTGGISVYNTGIELGKLRNYNGYTPGEFDELRIWDTALTQAEIRSYMTKKVTNSHPNYANLVAYYNVDSGSGSILVDQTSNGNNGTLINSPTWQTSSAPLGNDNSYITLVSNGSNLNLAHSDGSDLTINVTSGTAESLYIYNVEEEPNVTTPPIGQDQLSQGNYFGVKAFGSSSLVYEVVYNYEGHSGIADENNLRLSSRADNATPIWTEEESATLDTGANTLTLGGQTGTEFILGSIAGNTLPVEEYELIDFTIYPNPTNDILKLSEIESYGGDYKIFDLNGKRVMEGKLNSTKEIRVDDLNSGVYFLKLEKGEVYKFLKH